MSKIAPTSKRRSIALVLFAAAVCAAAASAAHATCVTKESRCGKDWAFCPENSFLAPIVGDGCSTIPAECPKPAYCRPDPRSSCGERWTEWRSLGDAANDPCPAGCVATERVGHDSRTTDMYFHMEYRVRWACAGTPPGKASRASK